MPSNWSVVDSMFPTFKGNESPQQQIAALVDYMRILTEQLQYSLDNLDTSNWNATALEDFSTSTTADLDETVRLLTQKVNAMGNAINAIDLSLNGMRGLPTRITDVESAVSEIEKTLEDNKGLPSRVQGLETDVAYLQEDNESHKTRLDDNEAAIEAAQADIDALEQVVQLREDEVSIGAEGQTLHLIGNIYINGVLYGQESEI